MEGKIFFQKKGKKVHKKGDSHGTRSDSQQDESLRIYVYVRDVPR
jgi:sarcosine oxidase delta subunit